MPILALSAGTLLYKHLSKRSKVDLDDEHDTNATGLPVQSTINPIAVVDHLGNSGPSRSSSPPASVSTPRMSTSIADDKASLHSFSSTIATESEVPTTPPPEYDEDITPRGSFQEDRELDLTTVPGLEGLPSIITQPTSDLQPSFRRDSASSGSYSPLTGSWDGYRIPLSTLSKDRTTVTTTDPLLLTNAAALSSFIRSQAALPPVPEIHITGSHSGSSSSSVSLSGKARDFEIRLNLLRYIIPPQSRPANAPNMTNYIRVQLADGTTRVVTPSNDQGSLSTISDIASAFVADRTTNKCLVITRSVTNWDKAYLKGCILSLLSDLRYRGDVTVTFPVSHAKVIVQPERTVADSFKSLFYDKKVYEGIDAVWPYADSPPPSGKREDEAGVGANGSANTNVARTFAVRSEQGWWHDWKGAIERAVLEGRKGVVGVDDLLDIRLGFPGPGRMRKDWGGNAW